MYKGNLKKKSEEQMWISVISIHSGILKFFYQFVTVKEWKHCIKGQWNGYLRIINNVPFSLGNVLTW